MYPLLVPPASGDRVFPDIGPEFTREIPPAAGEFGRLLTDAVEAERQRRCRRADFFWRELHQAVRTRPLQWDASVDALDEDEARRRFVREVLIEIHCGFYNGWVERREPAKPDDRAFAHLDYVRKLHDASDLSDEQQAELLWPAWVARLNLWLEAGATTTARTKAEELLRELPGHTELLESLIGLHVAEVYSRLQNGESETANKADAQTLERGLERIRALRREYPDHLGLYNAMGHFHHLRAVKLANTGELAQALEQVQRALTYDPSMKEAQESRQRLLELMQRLQEEVRKAVITMRKHGPNASMTEEGLRLKQQADLGLKLMEAFAESSAAEVIADGRQRAEARALWRAVRLPVPEDRWDEKAFALLEALGPIVDKPPKTEKGLRNAWRRRAAKDPDLADVDASVVHTFLVDRLMSDPEAEDTEEGTDRSLEAPVLEVLDAPSPGRDLEPFGPWLRSRQDFSVKLLAAAALILLMLSGWVAVREAGHRALRDELYEELSTAVAQSDYQAALDAAERYLSTPFSGAFDHRKAVVHDLYDKAFVHWFLALDDPDEQQAYIDRYNEFTNN